MLKLLFVKKNMQWSICPLRGQKAPLRNEGGRGERRRCRNPSFLHRDLRNEFFKTQQHIWLPFPEASRCLPTPQLPQPALERKTEKPHSPGEQFEGGILSPHSPSHATRLLRNAVPSGLCATGRPQGQPWSFWPPLKQGQGIL